MAGQFDPVFDAAAKEWRVDPNLLRAVAAQESTGNTRAVSPKGAIGLMQIMPDTAKGLGVTDPSDPVQNIWAGAKYLSEALDKEKTPEDALRYYHGGPAWRDNYGPESAGYAPGVTAHYQRIAAANAPTAPTQGSAPVASSKYDDFLKRTASGDASGPSKYDDFLKRTASGDAGAAPVAAADGVEQGQGGIARNAAAGVIDAGSNVINFMSDPVGNLAKLPATAAVAAHDALAPVFGYPRFDDETRNMLLGDNVPQPGTRAVSAIGNALGADPSQVAANTTAERLTRKGVGAAGSLALLGPGGILAPVAAAGGAVAGDVAGRAVPAWAAPAAELAGNALGYSAGMRAPVVSARVGLPGANALNAWASAPERGPVPTMTVRPNAAAEPASPGTISPVPQSVGAAASTASDSNMTPKEIAAYQATAEGQKLLEPQPAGVADRNAYIPGVNPNQAEIEQSVNTAREMKALNVAQPEVSQAAKDIAASNNEARQQHFAKIAGSPVDVMNAEAARSAQATADLQAAFGNKTATDATPVVDTIKSILTDPRGQENTALQQYVKPLLARLTDDKGVLKSDPEQLYGLREDISRMQSKAARAETPTLDHVTGQLSDIKSALDDVIEKGAPGYQQYLKNYADASRPIDAMNALQAHEPKLYDSQNRMTYNKVQTMMRQIVDSRNSSGLNNYKSIPDETMQQLWALRDDLRRSASAQELARTPGSDTTQTAFDVIKNAAAGHAGTMGAAVAGHVLAGPVGGAAIGITKNLLGNALSARTARRQTARGLQLLNPDPSQLRHPLAP